VANPSAPGADAAYDRAVAAYQQGSYDIARQWALEALAQDAEHARARALLGRLDSMRRPVAPQTPPGGRPAFNSPNAGGSEVVSTDPTVLITRASRSSNPEPIEPTVLVRREDRQRRSEPEPYVPPPIAAPRAPAPAEPTVIVQRSSRGASNPPAQPSPSTSRQATAGAAAGGSWRDRLPKAPGAAGTRGIVVAVAAVAAAALILIAGIAAVRWLWPSGQTLTLTKPSGGTILGPGLECGSHGSDCAVTRATGDAVELIAQADDGYVFSGFTGDCAPAGRISMTEAHKCGATFDKVTAAAPAVTFPLTINKPTGGTIIGAGGILCGTLGNNCAANVPNGQPVTLHFEADAGYTFLAFTGECDANGDTTMTSAKTCGATFTQTSTPVARGISTAEPRPRPKPREPVESAPPVKPAAPPPQAPAPVTPAPPPIAAPPQPETAQTPLNTDKPAEAPISAEQHATNEIQQLVTNYCASLETLQADRVKKLWPLAPMSTLRDQFRQYKSLRCTITSPPKFDRLDARAAGGAQVKFGMKQEIQRRSGGAPIVQETIVTLVASRTDFQSPWLIDRVRHDPKPKD
jgi:hypothetical protein